MSVYSAFKNYSEQYRTQHNIHECDLCKARVARHPRVTDPSRLTGRVRTIHLCDKCVVYGSMLTTEPPPDWLDRWFSAISKPRSIACGGIVKGIEPLMFSRGGDVEPIEPYAPVELTHSNVSTSFVTPPDQQADPEEVKKALNDMVQKMGKHIDRQLLYGLRRDFEMNCSYCDKPISKCECERNDIFLRYGWPRH